MSVIGNNLANTNTLGFKGSRSVFSDLLSSNVFGSGGNSQVGRGVGLSTVDNIFSQGTFETTSSDTDVAVEGDGFFILKETETKLLLYPRRRGAMGQIGTWHPKGESSRQTLDRSQQNPGSRRSSDIQGHYEIIEANLQIVDMQHNLARNVPPYIRNNTPPDKPPTRSQFKPDI